MYATESRVAVLERQCKILFARIEELEKQVASLEQQLQSRPTAERLTSDLKKLGLRF